MKIKLSDALLAATILAGGALNAPAQARNLKAAAPVSLSLNSGIHNVIGPSTLFRAAPLPAALPAMMAPLPSIPSQTQTPASLTIDGLRSHVPAIEAALADGKQPDASARLGKIFGEGKPERPVFSAAPANAGGSNGKPSAGSEGVEPRLRNAVLKVNDYAEKERISQQEGGEPLTKSEMADLTEQLLYLADPNTKIPADFLGNLEGISLVIDELLTNGNGPVGRGKEALRAARKLLAKVRAL